MNRIYRLVFNRTLGVRQVVSELAAASGKASAVCALSVGLFSPAAFGASYTVADEAELRTALEASVDGDSIVFEGNITLSSNLQPITHSITIHGNGHALSGNEAHRGFFVHQGKVDIFDLAITHATAQGGSGGGNGGGGMGAGGGLFVDAGAAVTLTNVQFDGNRAIGGSGGNGTSSGGGGGMEGNGANRSPASAAGGGLGGGGGYGGGNVNPGSPGGALTGSGGAPGNPQATGPWQGGDGVSAFAGGGGGVNLGGGGTGGDFGGGGGAGTSSSCGIGGNGGFGGGGGGGCEGRRARRGGSGGFGGGGGGNSGTAGFGGGGGGADNDAAGGGGGGAGFGGAVFVREGGSLTIAGNSGFQNNAVAGGGGGPGLQPGEAGGNGSSGGSSLFLQGNGNLGIAPGAGVSAVLDTGTVADQSALGGTDANAGRWGLIKTGEGLLQLNGTAGFSGSVQVNQGTVSTGSDASLGRSNQLDLNGGTLRYLAGFNSTRSVALGPAGGTFDTHGFSGTWQGDVTGSGKLIKRGDGTLTLSGTNTHGGGTELQGGVLSISSDNQLGTASGMLAFDGGTLRNDGAVSSSRAVTLGAGGGSFETQADMLLSGDISGAGRLIKTGGSSLVVTGAAGHGGGTTISAGTLQIGDGGNTGSLSGDVVNNATLAFNRSGATSFAGAISGSGGVVKGGDGRLVLSGVNTYGGGTRVTGGTLSISADHNLGAVAGALTLDGGTLQTTAAVTTARAITFENAARFQTDADLTTTGVVSGSGGLIKMGPGTLTLAGANTYGGGTSLWGGKVSVSSDANLGAFGVLAFDGGMLQVTGTAFTSTSRFVIWGSDGGGFDIVEGDATFSVGQALTKHGSLRKEGAGTLVLSGANTYPGGTIISAGTLAGGAGNFGSGTITNNAALRIDQSGDGTLANTITGSGTLTKTGAGALTLTGSNSYAGGTTISGGTVSISSDQNLGAASGLLKLDGGTLRTGGAFTTARSVSLGAGGGTLQTDADLTASGIVSGAGGLVKTGGGTLTLAGTNSYAGGTALNAGVVSASSNANLGDAAGSLGFNGGTLKTTADFSMNRATTLDAQGGTLDTVAGTALTHHGVIGGAGGLTKTGAGTLTLSGENSYSGGTDLKEGGVAVRNNRALGTGELAMHEGTTLRFAADGLTLANPIAFTDAVDPIVDTGPFTATLTGAITGPGDLSKIGSGTLILSGANTYTGATAVTEGTLRAGVPNTFSPASAHSVSTGATLDLAGFSQSVAGLSNAGTVSLIGAAPGTTLTVTGPYVGNNGLLRLGTFLGGSASASDRLVLSGPSAVATGNTTVQVVNLGGFGALTSGNGIELVSALNGATTTAQSTKDAFALQGGHVDAGAYEYRLQAGDVAGAGENWYLRSTSTIIPPAPPAPPAPPTAVDPPSPGLPPAPAGPSSPPPAPAAAPIQVPTYRAEVPLFAALPEQLRQGNLAMLGNLHQRLGDDDVKTGSTSTPATGERRAWGRVLSTRRNIQQGGTVSPQSDGRLSGLQAGTDLWAAPHWRAGLYAGQLDGELQVRGFARGIANLAVGSNDLRSQYLGGYATYSNDSGFYADAVLQAGRHRYEVKPQTTLRTKGKGSSLSASVEIGQSFALGEGWQIEPQAQLVHQRLDLDDVDIAGARVRQERDSHWLARVGVRVKGDIATRAGRLQPYARVNLYRASGGNDSTRFISPAASTAIASSTGSTSTELAAGFTLRLSESTSLYGELGKQWASGGDTRVKSQLNASAGLRVRW